MDTKKTGHQALPKSVRRRAMSHNRYRIPLKLRSKIDQELQKAERMQKLPKCRKHIRKRRHLVHAYKLRDSKNRWLSTHMWAAKRMRMVPYYGFKIAYTPNNKSFRSAYRFTRHSCTVSDVSYMHTLCMTSKDFIELPSQIKIKSNCYP
jgi:ribonuclease P/MRP protein subunit POP1